MRGGGVAGRGLHTWRSIDPASPVCCLWRLIEASTLCMSSLKLSQKEHASVLCGKISVWPRLEPMP